VRTYVARVYAKLGVSSRQQAIDTGLDYNLL